MILEENFHQKVDRLAEGSVLYHFPICCGHACVRVFIAHNSSRSLNVADAYAWKTSPDEMTMENIHNDYEEYLVWYNFEQIPRYETYLNIVSNLCGVFFKNAWSNVSYAVTDFKGFDLVSFFIRANQRLFSLKCFKTLFKAIWSAFDAL